MRLIFIVLSTYLVGCNPLVDSSNSEGNFDFSYENDSTEQSLKIESVSPDGLIVDNIVDSKVNIKVTTNMRASCHLDSLANQAGTDAMLLFLSENNRSHSLEIFVQPKTKYYYVVTCETLNLGGSKKTQLLTFETPEIRDINPPVISIISPTGTLPSTTRNAQLRVGTNEASNCRYSLDPVPYSAMTFNMQQSADALSHTASVTTKAGLRYKYYIECSDTKGNSSLISSVIEFQVAPEGAQDKDAPILSNLFPSQNLPSGSQSTSLMLTTNENASCKWTTDSNHSYDQMSTMQVTGSFNHIQAIAGLIDGQNYAYFIQCRDTAQNLSVKSTIAFQVNIMELDGAKLYANHCMNCHSVLANSTKLNRTAQQISSAIQNISQMNSLSFLQAQQIEEIAKALYVADIQAPVISDALPSGVQPKTITSVNISVKTDEPSLCRYHISDVAYDSMTIAMNAASNGYIHNQSQVVVVAGQSYNFFVRCKDEADNKNIASTVISFSVEAANAPDNTAPIISSAMPSGKLAPGTTQATLSVVTNESALCRYSNSNAANFVQMSPMSTTGTVSHSQVVNNLSNGNTYSYYVICRDVANNDSIKQTISFEVPVLNLDGASLYAENCMGCHGQLNVSNKKNRSVTQIIDAIAQNTVMRNQAYLKVLSNVQITAIADVLKDQQLPSGNPVGVAKQKYIIGTRRFIVSKLNVLFVNDNKNTTDLIIEGHINRLIKENDASHFGGACADYDNDCPGATEEIQVSGLMTPSSTSVRRSYMIRACHNILSIDRAISNALSRAGVSLNDNANNDIIVNNIYNVFYPGVEITNEVRNDLKSIFNESKQNGMNNTDSWRMLLSPLCKSALFEIY